MFVKQREMEQDLKKEMRDVFILMHYKSWLTFPENSFTLNILAGIPKHKTNMTILHS